ncbi:MAG: hypothetical protein P4L51_11065 [Puia sp.]|nr:hypothetical protein [Puia sp.]
MNPLYSFSDVECDTLLATLQRVTENPYRDYNSFARAILYLVEMNEVPAFFRDVCATIKHQRVAAISNIHVLRNCPIDREVPYLNSDDPLSDKYTKKRTFIGEAFLALFAQLVRNPLLAYGTRHNGDFFTDVVAINRYSVSLRRRPPSMKPGYHRNLAVLQAVVFAALQETVRWAKFR